MRAVLALSLAVGLLAGRPAPDRPGREPRNAETASATTTPPTRRDAELKVLIYNIEGLHWPARSGRAKQLRQIGNVLRDLRANGMAPDVVLFQEAFSPAARRAVDRTGYPVIVRGPSRSAQSSYSVEDRLPGRRNHLKGELGIRLISSGLIVASRYPVVETAYDAYSRRSCAGFDCLANKGVVLVRIRVPNVPEPIDIANTHMNARGASKVSPARNLASHRAQARELSMFLQHHHAAGHALILAGDFNMARSVDRFAHFRSLHKMDMVHEYCSLTPSCDVRMSWDGDAPWMDTQDLQFFSSGNRVQILPSKVQAMFDGSPGSPRLSDHDGLEVTYRLIFTR
jgi:endonuclease/exonuclease/phosphatase family metal-dependent hydrolase